MNNCKCNNNIKKPVYNPCTHKPASIDDFYNKSEINDIIKCLEQIKASLVQNITNIFNDDSSNLKQLVEKINNLMVLLNRDNVRNELSSALIWLEGFSNGTNQYDIFIINDYITALKEIIASGDPVLKDNAQELLDIYLNLQDKVVFNDEEDVVTIIEMLEKYKETITDKEELERIETLIKTLKTIIDGTGSWEDVDIEYLYELLKKIKNSSIYNDYRKWFEDNSKKFEWYNVTHNTYTFGKELSIKSVLYSGLFESVDTLNTVKSWGEDMWRVTPPTPDLNTDKVWYIWKRVVYELKEYNSESEKYDNIQEVCDYSWYSILPDGVTLISTEISYWLGTSTDEDENGNPIIGEGAEWSETYPTSFKEYEWLWTRKIEHYSNGESSEPNYTFIPLGYKNPSIPENVSDGDIFYEDNIFYYQPNNTSIYNTQEKIYAADVDELISWSSVYPTPIKGKSIWKKIVRTYYTYHTEGIVPCYDVDVQTFYECIYTPNDGETPVITVKYLYSDDNIHQPKTDAEGWLDNPTTSDKTYVWVLTSCKVEDSLIWQTLLCTPNKAIKPVNGKDGKDGENGNDGVTTIIHDGLIEQRFTYYYKDTEYRDSTYFDNNTVEWSHNYPDLTDFTGWVYTRIVSEYYEVDENGNKGTFKNSVTNYLKEHFSAGEYDTTISKVEYALTQTEEEPTKYPYSKQPTDVTGYNWIWRRYIITGGGETHTDTSHWAVRTSNPTESPTPENPTLSDWELLLEYWEDKGYSSAVNDLKSVLKGSNSWLGLASAQEDPVEYINELVALIPNTGKSWCVNTSSYLKSILDIIGLQKEVGEVSQDIIINYDPQEELDLSGLLKEETFNQWSARVDSHLKTVKESDCDCKCSSRVSDLEKEILGLSSKVNTLCSKINSSTQPTNKTESQVPYFGLIPYIGSCELADVLINAGEQWFPFGWFYCSNPNAYTSKYPQAQLNIVSHPTKPNVYRINFCVLKDGRRFGIPNPAGSLGFNTTNPSVYTSITGVDSITLTIDQLPKHNHAGDISSSDSFWVEDYLGTNNELNSDVEARKYSGLHSHDFIIPGANSSENSKGRITKLNLPHRLGVSKIHSQYAIQDSNIQDGSIVLGETTLALHAKWYGASKANDLSVHHTSPYRTASYSCFVAHGNPSASYAAIDEGFYCIPGGDYNRNTTISALNVNTTVANTRYNFMEGEIPIGVLVEPSGHRHRHKHYNVGKGEPIPLEPKMFCTNYLIRLDVLVPES